MLKTDWLQAKTRRVLSFQDGHRAACHCRQGSVCTSIVDTCATSYVCSSTRFCPQLWVYFCHINATKSLKGTKSLFSFKYFYLFIYLSEQVTLIKGDTEREIAPSVALRPNYPQEPGNVQAKG